jgi:predicted translation initiation factor SUI1
MGRSGKKTVLFVGPGAAVAEAAFTAVAGRMGLPWQAAGRDKPADLEGAAAVVSLNRADHQPTLGDRAEYWDLPANPDPAAVDRAVMDLIARLLGGGGEAPEPPLPPPAPTRKPATVKVSRETAGRRGKGVTVVSEVPLDEAGLRELAAALKQKCGTGGTVKGGRIEIQGDHRDRLTTELEKLGYRVKRAGG